MPIKATTMNDKSRNWATPRLPEAKEGVGVPKLVLWRLRLLMVTHSEVRWVGVVGISIDDFSLSLSLRERGRETIDQQPSDDAPLSLSLVSLRALSLFQL